MVGPRLSKKQLLERFQEIFSNVSGLTLSKTYDSKAAMKYGSKIESRVKSYGLKIIKVVLDTGKSRFQKWLRLGQRDIIHVNYQLVVLRGLYQLLQC